MSAAWAVVVAAGRGERFGDPHGLPKTLRPLGGEPMYLRSVLVFDRHPRVAGTVLVFPAIWEGQLLEHLPGRVTGPLRMIAGGDTRGASVRAGLDELPTEAQTVVVHDAARPLIEPILVDRVLDGLGSSPACICAVPVSDTIKRVADGAVTQTVLREGLVLAQTPQAFRLESLRAAHARAERDGIEATDDAGLIEADGGTVAVVAGDERNIKVTTQRDLVLAEALLHAEVP